MGQIKNIKLHIVTDIKNAGVQNKRRHFIVLRGVLQIMPSTSRNKENLLKRTLKKQLEKTDDVSPRATRSSRLKASVTAKDMALSETTDFDLDRNKTMPSNLRKKKKNVEGGGNKTCPADDSDRQQININEDHEDNAFSNEVKDAVKQAVKAKREKRK